MVALVPLLPLLRLWGSSDQKEGLPHRPGLQGQQPRLASLCPQWVSSGKCLLYLICTHCFALINFNLRCQFCAKASFSFLLILLVFQESTSLRDEQCQRYNDVPYQGNYHTWRGAQQADSPCSLDCQAETDPDVIQRFVTHAEDGTRCSGDGSLKLCLEGVCEVRRPGLSYVVRSISTFNDFTQKQDEWIKTHT